MNCVFLFLDNLQHKIEWDGTRLSEWTVKFEFDDSVSIMYEATIGFSLVMVLIGPAGAIKDKRITITQRILERTR